MLQTPLLRRKVTIHSRKVNTPHINSVTATAEAGGVCSQPAPTVHFMKANHHQKSAVRSKGDHAESIAGLELQYARDDLGDSAIGEGQRNDGGDCGWRQDAGVDAAENYRGQAKARQSRVAQG